MIHLAAGLFALTPIITQMFAKAFSLYPAAFLVLAAVPFFVLLTRVVIKHLLAIRESEIHRRRYHS